MLGPESGRLKPAADQLLASAQELLMFSACFIAYSVIVWALMRLWFVLVRWTARRNEPAKTKVSTSGACRNPDS